MASKVGVLPKEMLYYGEKELHVLNSVKRFTPHVLQDGEICDLVCTNLRILFVPTKNLTNYISNSNYCSQNVPFTSRTSTSHSLNYKNKPYLNLDLSGVQHIKNVECNINNKYTDKKSLVKTSNNNQPFIFYSNVDYYTYYCNSKHQQLRTNVSKKPYKHMSILKKGKKDKTFCEDGIQLHIFCKNLRVEVFSLANNISFNKISNTKMQNFVDCDIFINTVLNCTTQSKLKLYRHFAVQSLMNILKFSQENMDKIQHQLTSYTKNIHKFTKLKMCNDIQFFLDSKDWLAELERNGVKGGWRITLVNEFFHLSPTLPKIFVVPINHLDSTLKSASYFSNGGGRIPFWSWASRYGCTLVRSSLPSKRHTFKVASYSLSNRFLFGPRHDINHHRNINQNANDNNVNPEDMDYKLVETLRQLHPNRKVPIMVNIDYELFGDRRNKQVNTKGSKPSSESFEDPNTPIKGEIYLNSTPGLIRVHQSFRALKKLIREKTNAFKFQTIVDERNYLNGRNHVKVSNRNSLPALSSQTKTLLHDSHKDEVDITNDDSNSGSYASYLSPNNKYEASLSDTITSQAVYDFKTTTTHVSRYNNHTNARYINNSSSSSLTLHNKRVKGLNSRHHKNWLSSYESTGWGQLVRSCIQTASTVAYHMMVDQFSVILVEQDSTLFSPLVSSLAILLMDPHARTLSGFNSLIQKEWIIMGHPFRSLYGIQDSLLDGADYGIHIKSMKKARQVPIFHLFLECVWQISLQYPSSFAFSEKYLIYLSDSCYSPTNDSFTFNNMHERFKFYSELISEFGKFDESMWDNNRFDKNIKRLNPEKANKFAMTTRSTSIKETSENEQNLLHMINSVWNYRDLNCMDINNDNNEIPLNFLNPWYSSQKLFSCISSKSKSHDSNFHHKCMGKTHSTNSQYLMAKISPPLMVFWSNYYLRWTDDHYLSPLNGIDLSYCMRTVLNKLTDLSLKRDIMEKQLEKASKRLERFDY